MILSNGRSSGRWVDTPAVRTGARKTLVEGNPDRAHLSTSYAERANLHDAHPYAPVHEPDERVLEEGGEPCLRGRAHMMYYNFVRIHRTLKVTPAMASGVSDRLWEIGDVGALVEAADVQPKRREPYQKHASSKIYTCPP